MGADTVSNEKPAGRVVWWGRGVFWNYYYSNHTNGVLESDDETATNVIAIAAQPFGGLAVRSDGTVFSFGRVLFAAPEIPAGLSNVVSVAIEGNSCWAIKKDGAVVQWGEDQDESNIVASLTNVVSITFVRRIPESYLAVENDGTVLGFRLDDKIQRVKVTGELLTNVAACAEFGPMLLVLKKDGSVIKLESGNPSTGMFYDPASYEYWGDPVTVDGIVLTNVTAIASAGEHALALKRDGTVIALGRSFSHETDVPAGLSNVTAIAASDHLSLALKRDGTVVAWGGDYSGQTSIPTGLSNVVAIAAGGDFGLALTTGGVPSSVYIIPHGQLEMNEREADIIFKGQVISTQPRTNESFPNWAKPYETEFKVISVLKGNIAPDQRLVFWHYTSGPMAWSGASPPAACHFEPGQSYLVFAAKLDKPDYLYSPPSDADLRTNEYRQLNAGAVIRTLDEQPISDAGFKAAHWLELSRLLNDSKPTNQIYAIEMLDGMSLSSRPDYWRHSDDFKRKDVLKLLVPLITSTNEAVANRALACFPMDPKSTSALEPFTSTLIAVANDGVSSERSLNAIAGLSGTHFETISNSVARLLQNTNKDTRSKAVSLLRLYPGEFARQALRERSVDESPEVRATVADVIGDLKDQSLLPVLAKLFADPVGLKREVPPFSLEELEAGARSNVGGDVHASAGFALLQFDVGQVGGILKSNLNDAGFRLQFLCKLADSGAEPWIDDMVSILEARQKRIRKQAETSGVKETENYYRGLMSLSGSYYQCWKIIYDYLKQLSPEEFNGNKQDRRLTALENAGTTGSQEPVSLYELYRTKGLNERAATYRADCEKNSSYDISIYFRRADERLTNKLSGK